MSTDSRWDVVVIGAGAAGLLAATRAAERGRRVLLLEKNRKAGVKILMSGGTRCNLTQATDRRGIIDAFGKQGRFLHSALAAFSPDDLVSLIESEGVATKVESTGKIFPQSDRAIDILQALLSRLNRSKAELALNEPVTAIAYENDRWHITTPRRSVSATSVIVTTGGQSYPGCGTTGDGYHWLERLSHTIVPPRPALVPVTIRADWAKALRGVTIPDVQVRLMDGESTQGKPLDQRRDSMLFAHFGLSGPVVLDVSRHVAKHGRPRQLTLNCNFLPQLSTAQLERHIRDWSVKSGKKQLAGLLSEWLPRRLSESLLVSQCHIPTDRRAAELSRSERDRLMAALTDTAFPVTGTSGFEKAEVTTGGVSLEEVDSRTMQSKIVAGLFLAGEILDLDGPIGGYNFQAAFSTGWLAGTHA